MKKVLFVLLAITASISLQAQQYRFNNEPNGFSISNKNGSQLTLRHNLNTVTIENASRSGAQGQVITLSGIYLPNEAGAPDLPSSSTFIAIPNGAKASIQLISSKTKVIGNVDLIPAAEPQLDNDDSPAVFQKNPAIYSRNAFYPESPFRVSEVSIIRGVQVVQVGVMPFQYNPVTKELVVYEDLQLELTTEGGDDTYGDLRYRTPEWDQILEDVILNREVLPKVDYGQRLRKHYENRETGCEYMIITPDNDDFVQLADSIRIFRTEQGIPTEIFTVSQCGGNNDQAIRNFIRNAYNTWDMPPAAVLILGDHHNDPTLGVVSFTMNNHPGGNGYNPYISDHAYSVMDNDHMPDIILGRITGRNYDELYRMIKKDLDYERTPPTNPDFYDKPVTAMGFQLERWFQLCSEVVNGFWEYGLEKHPVRLNAIYQGTPGNIWSTYEHTNTVVNYFGPTGCGYIPNSMSHLTDWSGTGNKVNECINKGAFIVQHRDHGAEELWGEPGYSIGHINMLTNPDLTYVMSCNCLTGRFNYSGNNGCFAEAFHRHQHGALGLIAATQVSYSFVNDVYVWGAYDNMWPDFMPTYGTQHPSGFILPAFGNAAGKYFLRQSSWADEWIKEITYYLFHQHGDAYMNLYSEMPQQLTVEMLPVLVAGSGTYSVKADEGATICLTVGDQIIGFDQATGAMQEVAVTPQVPGTRVKLTIKKQNYYRYEHELNTIPADGPYLIFNTMQINDEDGNQNQAADYNESFKLNVSLHNVGSSGINNVTVLLSCSNPKVQIIQNQATYASIAPDEIQMVNDAFTLRLGDDLDDGEKIPFHLHISNSDASFIDSLQICVNAPLLQYTGISFTDLNGEPTDRLMRGESTLMSFHIQNSGHSRSMELSNALTVKAPFLSIAENQVALAAIDPGCTSQATFRIDVQESAPSNNIIDYLINTQSGYYSTLSEGNIYLGYTAEDFESEQLNPLMDWDLNSGDKAWYVAEELASPGNHVMHSPQLEDRKKSDFYIAITCDQPGTVSFRHKTSTEEKDILSFYINNKIQAEWSGISEWESSEFELKEGFNLLKFMFKKDAEGSAGDDCVLFDDFHFPPMADLIMFVGDDTEGCPGEPYSPNSYAYHQNGIFWSTEGDGYFDDPTIEQPSYHFGDNDIANGQVTLTLTATSIHNETQQESQLTVHVLDLLEGTIPQTPIGDNKVDLRLLSENTYTINKETTSACHWYLEPENAGNILAEDNQATIVWNKDFRGLAALSVKLSNECGESEISNALHIEVFNSTNVNENQISDIMVYPNPASGVINIKSESIASDRVLIRIIDSQGKLAMATERVFHGKFFEASVDISSLRSGLYDIQIVSDESIYNTRIIVL